MRDSVEDQTEDSQSSMDAVADAAAAAFRKEVEKAYRRGFKDALALIGGHVAGLLGEDNHLPAVARGKRSTGGRGTASTRKRPTARAKPGEISQAIEDAFQDGQGKTIKEIHDLAIAAGRTASREGIARELRHRTEKYRTDGRSWFPASDSSGEAGARGPSQIFS